MPCHLRSLSSKIISCFECRSWLPQRPQISSRISSLSWAYAIYGHREISWWKWLFQCMYPWLCSSLRRILVIVMPIHHSNKLTFTLKLLLMPSLMLLTDSLSSLLIHWCLILHLRDNLMLSTPNIPKMFKMIYDSDSNDLISNFLTKPIKKGIRL